MKREIYDPKVIKKQSLNKGEKTQIRLTDIDYPEMEFQLLCLSDHTLKAIFEAENRMKAILIDIDDDLSSDEE